MVPITWARIFTTEGHGGRAVIDVPVLIYVNKYFPMISFFFFTKISSVESLIQFFLSLLYMYVSMSISLQYIAYLSHCQNYHKGGEIAE